jgi:uncharacterized protein YbjT (DUF2867 family)
MSDASNSKINAGPFLVLGATGTQGGAVAKHLINSHAKVRALTRNPASPKSLELAKQGVEVIGGDMNDIASLSAAFTGVKGVFSLQDFYAPGVGKQGEIAQGLNVLEAAKAANVPHLVQSVMGDSEGGVSGSHSPAHFQSKAAIEAAIKAADISWTLLGTVWFLENLLNPKMVPKMTFPILGGSLKPTTKFAMLSVDDLGAVASMSLLQPERFKGQKLNLANDSLTVPEMKIAYQKATGKNPKSWKLPAWLFRYMAKEFAEQLLWHNTSNFSFEDQQLRALRPNAPDFQSFIKRNEIIGL